ncbi:type III-B CRISPR module RAMP protein Cmr1 [Saccharolobus islandicus]|uniref:CRISPR-associated RAMP protein, Cmr1 family n=1 Tax=Saccharolobus islandicus (strain REY15A) TaxID=930945 RepID=F0NE28_SACI5|nr:type III-B CRISPR module RAMP protein Cmr1 [Sulfolobus islandicus]ADX84964.1 CRISPR-associated RAMP protein, Cmr1 family [Sulfolobus islandicus REY15A]
MSEKINLENLDAQIDRLVKQRLIAEIVFKGITPWWGGDYNGFTSNYVDEEEIVGRLRWFLRTVYNRFCVNNLSDYEEAERRVSEYLGSTNNKSIYTFKVRNVKVRNGNYSYLQRVSFILQGKPRDLQDRFLPKNVDVLVLDIYSRKASNYDKIIIDGLLITLAFLGIGKGANRGFGRFIPINCDNLQNTVCNNIIKGDIIGAFSKFYDEFKNEEKCNKVNKWIESAVPLAPLTQTSEDSISKTGCKNSEINTLLDIIQTALLKSTLKENSYNMNVKDPGPFIHTWIYGLPRHSKVPRKINQCSMDVEKDNLSVKDEEVKKLQKMGYFELNGDKLVEPRRQSMLIISPVFDGNTYSIYVLPFLSLKDNEEELNKLVHKGIHITSNIIHLASVKSILKGNNLIGTETQLINKRSDLSKGNLQTLIVNYIRELILNISKQCKGNTTSLKIDKSRVTSRSQGKSGGGYLRK